MNYYINIMKSTVDNYEKNTIYIYIYICIHIYACIYICSYIYIYIYNTAVLIKICRFLINVVKFTQTLTKLDHPTLRKGSIEERTQREDNGVNLRSESL